METALYLIPVTLGETEHYKVLPAYNREVILGIRHFVVENIRTARLVRLGLPRKGRAQVLAGLLALQLFRPAPQYVRYLKIPPMIKWPHASAGPV